MLLEFVPMRSDSQQCGHMDAYGVVAYLETDQRANVHFYQKLGFTVVAEADVMGVPNWFMSRPGGHPRKG
jgi:hypothetical protein